MNPNPLGYLAAAFQAHPEEAPTEADGLPSDLYRIGEACRLLGLSRSAVYRWFRRGRLTFYGRRGAYYVSLKQLLPPVKRELTHPPQATLERENGVRTAPRRSARGAKPPSGA